jgi:hypothetical protein
MAQADTHNSILDSSRRRFLAITAAASAVSASALGAAAMPVHQACALTPASADPIFAAIKRHQEAYGGAEDEARWELGTTEPTTLAGLFALLEYADASDVFGEDDLANIVGGARACLARHLA